MRLALAVLLVTAVAGYGPSIHSKPATGGCGSGGSGCGGIAPGGGGGDLPIGVIRSQPSQGGNRRVANIGGGGYWWQSNNPFVGAGSRAPSSGGGNVVVVGGGGGGGKFPASGGGGGGSFPGSRPTKFPLGGSSFPGSLQPIDNSIVGPMGICPPEFVCVHWQLCRNGQVILDGTGIIDKSKRRPAGQYDNLQGCGGDMICCGVTPGYTVPGVISTLTSQLPGSSETVQTSVGSNTPLHSSTHLSSVGTLSVNAPASDLHPGSAVPQRDSGFSSVGSAKPAPDEPTAVHTALPASSLSASPPFHSSISSQAGSVSSPGHELSDAYPTSAGSTTKLTGSVTHFDSSSDSNKPSSLSFSQTLTTQSSSNSKISSSQASHSTLHSSSQSLPAGSSNTQTSSQLDLSSLPTNHDLSAKPLVNDKQTSSHIDQSPSSGIQPHPDSKFESKQSIAVNVPNLHSAYPTLPADSSTSIGVPSLPGLYEPPVNDDTSLSQNDVSQSSSDSSSISSAHKITSPGVHSGTSDFVSDSHATSLTGIQNVPFTDSATSSGSHGSTTILGGQSTSVNKQHINQVSPQNPSVLAKIDQTVPTESSFVDSLIPEEYIPPTTSLDQGSSFNSVHLGEKLPCASQSKPNASESTVICDQSIHHSSTKVESFSSNLDASSIVESLSTTGTQDTQTSGISIISSNIPESEEHSVSQTYPQSDSSLTPDKNSGSAFGSNLPANAIPTLAGGYLPPDRESPSVHIQQSSAGKTASNGKPNFLDHGHLIASLSEAFGQSSTTNSGASGTQGTLHPTPVIGGHEGVSNQNHGGIPIVFNENVSPSGGSFGVVVPNDVRAPSAGLPKPSHGGNFGSGAGSKKPFLAGAGSGSSEGSYAQPGSSSGSFPKPETPGGSFNQPGCAGGSVGGCNQPGSFPQPSPGSSYPQPGDTGGPVGQLGSAGGSFPTTGSGGFNKKVTPGGTFPRPGSSGSFPDQLGSSSSGGSYSPPSTSGGNFNQPGSQGSGFNQPGSSGSGSYQPGSSGSGFNQPGSLGSGFNQPGSSGSGFNQPGSSGSGFNQPGSSGSGFNQPGSSGSGFNQPGSSGSGSFQKGSSGGGFNQPGASGSGSYQPGSSGSGFNQPGFPGFNQNNPGSPGSPGSQGYNQPGGNQGAPGSPGYKQPGQSGGGSNFPSGGYNQPSGGSLSQAGSSFPQKNVANPPMANMMGMMMGMGTPLIGGSCSAGTFCVPRFQCNPYNGFIIMDPAALQAVWPDSPQVPLLDCLIPAGVLDGGVCCQQMHPIVGPNGQVLD